MAQSTESNNKKKLYHLNLKDYTYDIEKLLLNYHNTYNKLLTVGVPFDDDTFCLFQAFKTAKDSQFTHYIKLTKTRWEEGEGIWWDDLASKAVAKYKVLKESGTWHEEDRSSKDKVALMATIKNIVTSLASKPKKGKGKQRESERGKSKPLEWKLVAPKENDLKSKTMSGKTYHWCLENGNHQVHPWTKQLQWIDHQEELWQRMSICSQADREEPPSSPTLKPSQAIKNALAAFENAFGAQESDDISDFL